MWVTPSLILPNLLGCKHRLAYWGCAGKSKLNVGGHACHWHTGLISLLLRRALAATSWVSLICRLSVQAAGTHAALTGTKEVQNRGPLVPVNIYGGAVLLVLLSVLLCFHGIPFISDLQWCTEADASSWQLQRGHASLLPAPSSPRAWHLSFFPAGCFFGQQLASESVFFLLCF